METLKQCTRCTRLLPTCNFGKETAAKDGLKSSCKDCRSVESKIYYNNNKSRSKELRKIRYENNKDVEIARNKKWSDANPEKRKAKYLRYRRRNITHINECAEIRRKCNLDKDASKSAKRRCDKIDRTPPWLSNDDLIKINDIYRKCDDINKLTGIKHHVDHIIPLKGKFVSGLHVPWNLQILPAIENLRKSNKVQQ